MKKILIIENDPKFYQIYQLNLKTFLECHVELIDLPEQVIPAIEDDPVDLIITRTNFLGRNLVKYLFEQLKQNNIDVPTLALGSSNEDLSEFDITHLSNGIQLKDIVKNAARILGITAQMMAKIHVDDYYPIGIQNFSFIDDSICDVYIYNGDIYELIIPRFTHFNQTAIEKHQINGVENLYVKKEDRLKIVNYITSSMISNIDFDSLDDNDQTAAQEVSHKLISLKLTEFGVTEETINLGKKAISSIAQNIIKTNRVNGLINKLLSNKSSYLFKHIQLTTFFGFHLIRNVDWGTKEQLDTFAFTAFYHDICLQNDKQAMIHSNEELQAANFDPKEKELVNKHAQKAATFIYQMPSFPMGVDQIIRQHHGTLNGIGFSEHYSTNISPLATVFMLSEETAKILLSAPESDDPFDFLLKRLKEKFNTARFKKYLKILESVKY